MKLTKIAGSCDLRDCPAVYLTDRGTLLVQGAITVDHGIDLPDGETVVEIPMDILRQAARDHRV